MLAQHGLEDLGAKLHRLSVAGKWDEMAAEVSDDVVHLFAAVGTYDDLASQIAQRFGGLTDVVAIAFGRSTPLGLQRELIQDIKRIPAVFQGWS